MAPRIPLASLSEKYYCNFRVPMKNPMAMGKLQNFTLLYGPSLPIVGGIWANGKNKRGVL
jgi:hypothetical protein